MNEIILPLVERLVTFGGEKLLPLRLTVEEVSQLAQIIYATGCASPLDLEGFSQRVRCLGAITGIISLEDLYERLGKRRHICIFNTEDSVFAILRRPLKRGDKVGDEVAPGFRLEICGPYELKKDEVKEALEKSGFPVFRHKFTKI